MSVASPPPPPLRPEAAAEQAAALSVVPEQLQGELRVLDVAVRQQQQVPDAAGRRQQAESSQGPPQLSAAPYWRETLVGGRGARPSEHPTVHTSDFCSVHRGERRNFLITSVFSWFQTVDHMIVCDQNLW